MVKKSPNKDENVDKRPPHEEKLAIMPYIKTKKNPNGEKKTPTW